MDAELLDHGNVSHPVIRQWHYPIMRRFGWIPESKSKRGFVRNFVYWHPDFPETRIKVCTGLTCDYFYVNDGRKMGYARELAPLLGEINGNTN